MKAYSKAMLKRTGLIMIAGILLTACGLLLPMRWDNRRVPGALWTGNSFASNGERIYFTATNDWGELIPYEGGPAYGMMMMQDWLACVSCHGPDGRGGTHIMHMQVMDAPDIRYEALNSETGEHDNREDGMEHPQGEYNLDTFRQAVVEGKHPDGEALSEDMPRWKMSDEDLSALFEYIKSLP